VVNDPIFDLPIQSPQEMGHWLKRDFLDPEGHPIFSAGLETNQDFRTSIENLYSIGGALFGDFVRERSLEGVALVSAYKVAEVLA
jgi:anaerobic glycerol-3-phosphate dehydrogenase